MAMDLLILFIVMNILNVVIQTIKSLATIKCGKTAAALINAFAYGLYTYIVVLTMCDLPLLTKCIVVAICNFIGVWVVKWGEEKARKDKLWKVEACVSSIMTVALDRLLTNQNIPHNYITGVGSKTIFNIYCSTQEQSAIVKRVLTNMKAKYFVSESKTL